MGCDSYYINDHHCLKFNEIDDRVRCLCTFPHNDEEARNLDRSRVLSLAYLGAAVVIAAHEDFDLQPGETSYHTIPNCLPEWIKIEIERHIL